MKTEPAANSFRRSVAVKPGADVIHKDSIFPEFIRKTFDQTDYRSPHCIGKNKIGNWLFRRDRGQIVMILPQRLRCMKGMTSRAK